MEVQIDSKKRIAQVWMSHADRNSADRQAKLTRILADCKAKKIFVCVYESGEGDLLECTKGLLLNHLANG